MNVPEKRRTTAVGPVKVHKTRDQLGILVLDGSASMKEPTADGTTKAKAVNDAVRSVFARFRESRSVENFSFAVVTFDEEAKLHTPVTAASETEPDRDYDPVKDHGGATNIGAGLLEAKRIANDFLRKAREYPSTVVIVVMSDGRDGDGGVGDPAETRRIADEIKSNRAIKICSTYFATADRQEQQEQNSLKSLASEPTGYQAVHDAESLRTFFDGSLSVSI